MGADFSLPSKALFCRHHSQGQKMQFSSNLVIVFLATVVGTARSSPCQPCYPYNHCIPVLEYCSEDAPSGYGISEVEMRMREYATSIRPPHGPHGPKRIPHGPSFGPSSNGPFRGFGQNCVVGYLFGMKHQPAPPMCRLRQPFVLTWVALAGGLMMMLLCCLCQCCCCGGKSNRGSSGPAARGDVVMVRA